MKKTPLYEEHVSQGGKIIDFGGWALPVQYSSVIQEHDNVRNNAGLFDVSHMGQILVKGTNAEKLIQRLITNDISSMTKGRVMYSPMCYVDGGTVDDILIYKLSNTEYLLVVNASNVEKDYKWILENLIDDVIVTNVSEDYALIAIQGPKSLKILKMLTSYPLEDIKPFRFEEKVDLMGTEALISRTGYTGEDGFEIYINPINSISIWKNLLKEGKEEGLISAGLGARDTLRFEAGMPLYGQEISKDITPVDAGLKRFIKFNKEDFIGREALIAQSEGELGRTLIGFEMIGRGVPRSHYEVSHNGEKIGLVTSGTYSPTLKTNLGMAIINNEYAQLDQEIDVSIRNKNIKAKIVKLPFYSKRKG